LPDSTFSEARSTATPSPAALLATRKDLLIASAFGLFALLWWLRTAGFGFVSFDDTSVLLAHPNLYNETSLLASLREIFFGYFPREEPLLLRDLSWAIDARLFGFENAFGYHLGNVVLNALCVALVYLLLRRTLARQSVALAVTACFAVLPLHVEPVSWVMGRKDLLAAFFLLSALLVQSFELSTTQKKHKRAAYAFAFVLLLCALFSKASSIVFFAVLGLHRLLYPYLEGGQSRTQHVLRLSECRKAAVAVLPHAAVAIAFFLWYRGVLSEYGVLASAGPSPFDPVHLKNVFLFGPLILGSYVSHLFWPFELSVYYRWPHVEIPLTGFEMAAAFLMAVALVASLVWLLRRRLDLAFFAVAALLLLAPYSGLFYVGFWSADRYVYLAVLGPLVVAATLLAEWGERGAWQQRLALAAALVFAVGSALVSFQHQGVWTDDASLWRYEAQRSEPSLLAIQSHAKAHLKEAEAAESDESRSALLAVAAEEIERGFARHEALGRQQTAYATPEHLQLARLHYLRGRVAELSGEALATQLRHYGEAYRLVPERLTAIFISRALFAMAGQNQGEKRQRLVENSFDYFVRYVAHSKRDPVELAESRKLLEMNYAGRFPYLEQRVSAARETYFQ